ncbi:hypothetical protein GCM10027285_08370 [Oleiagrimonas citrea]|uniref:Lysozyme n=1 Tax=Oleiagrimonas citrea TaxID=1665687 RepID=A0A846ZM07_9GAMM|nr:hypothetical protein [Oleiagrimonas citrea]NKZ38598.1 hypothetical protein [Oleiagrimonas citrea]
MWGLAFVWALTVCWSWAAQASPWQSGQGLRSYDKAVMQQSVPYSNPFVRSVGTGKLSTQGLLDSGSSLPACPHICLIVPDGESADQAIKDFEQANHCSVQAQNPPGGGGQCTGVQTNATAASGGSTGSGSGCPTQCDPDPPLPGNKTAKQYETDKLKTYEGDSPWMYIDTTGHVTVGIGDNLESKGSSKTESEAEALPFYICDRKTNKSCICDATHKCAKATKQQIKDGLAAVQKETQPAACKTDTSQCYTVNHYKSISDLRLKESDREQFVEDKLGDFHGDLVKQFPDFDTYPSRVQAAMYDMIYNLGAAGLKKFKKFAKAVKAKDWKTAAAESKRGGVQQSRNDYVKNLLMEAYNDEQKCKKSKSSGSGSN